ncbi:hypothetical protein SDC9_152883 [bioreactor metagenome]|uniref:Uncharacterized protein n=1 Tax=bioreactor metagenome TaxID=1076179 RepID=A0A645EWM9_9ZZZZ
MYYGLTKTVINKREFLFDVDCVTNEIKQHIYGYLWSIDKKDISLPALFRGYSWLKKFGLFTKTAAERKEGIKLACREIDIYESDVVDNVPEAIGINYFGGIYHCYYKTKYDPYYHTTLGRVYGWVRSGWINELILMNY